MTTLPRLGLSLLLAIIVSPAISAQLPAAPYPMLRASTSAQEDAPGGSALVAGGDATATTNYSAPQGVSSVMVLYYNETTVELTSNFHALGGGQQGSFSDTLPDTAAGDVIRVVCIFEMADGTADSTDQTVTVQPAE